MTINDREQLRTDLNKFADVGTDVAVTAGHKGFLIRMQRNGERTYWVDASSGRVTARHDNSRTYNSMTSLLGSREFADIERLLSTQSRVYPLRRYKDYIEPEGRFSYEEGGEKREDVLTYEKLTKRVDPSDRRLRLILLDGSAGVGKTTTIGRLVADRAAGKGPRVPILHVTSRGRRLVSFDDAIAVSIQSLNIGAFGYPQVPVLVRYGLIQIAIDGFDELADPEGYRNAWYALSLFLQQAGDTGPVILAGRDTFFDAQKFRSSLERFGARPTIETARLTATSTSTAVTWLNQKGWSLKEGSGETRAFLAEGSLLLRPFFLTKLAPLRSFDALIEQAGDPWAFLISDFVVRETKILADALALSVMDTRERLELLYVEAAEDMAERERNHISIEILTFLCEVAFSDVLPQEQLRILQQRIESIALLEPMSEGEEVEDLSAVRSFPSEAIYNYFLAQAMVRAALAKRVPNFLRRMHLGFDTSEAFANALRKEEERSSAIVNGLLGCLDRESAAPRLAGNLGTLILTAAQFLRTSDGKPFELSKLQCENVRWSGQLPALKLDQIEVVRVDARTCILHDVEFMRSSFGILAVDELTSFGVSHPSVSSLHLELRDGTSETLHDPKKIAEWFEQHSVQKDESDERQLPLVKYFDRVLMYFGRNHMARQGSSDAGGILLRDSKWPTIENILAAESMVERFRKNARPARGAPEFIRVIEPFSMLFPPAGEVGRRVRNAVLEEARREMENK